MGKASGWFEPASWAIWSEAGLETPNVSSMHAQIWEEQKPLCSRVWLQMCPQNSVTTAKSADILGPRVTVALRLTHLQSSAISPNVSRVLGITPFQYFVFLMFLLHHHNSRVWILHKKIQLFNYWSSISFHDDCKILFRDNGKDVGWRKKSF